MRRFLVRLAAGIALTAIVATSVPTANIYASSDAMFPAAGAALAAGNGTSFKDIKAQAARNAAKQSALDAKNGKNDKKSESNDLQVNAAAVVAPTDEAGQDGSGTPTLVSGEQLLSKGLVPSLSTTPVQMVQTPSSKAVFESEVINGVSVVGSASEAAKIEITSGDDSTAKPVDPAEIVTDPSAMGEAPLIDIQPEAVEVAEGEEDLSRTVIAKCESYVNVRTLPDETSDIVGKLYKNSAGTWLGKEGDWYKIESGSVTGYVKGEFVATGQAAITLAAEVGERVAVVNTTTLKIREEASTDSTVLGLVGMEDRLTVLEETDEWAKVSIEEGDGWVNKEYLLISTEFPKAESKEEEEARLAKEAEDRRKANAAAQKATKKKNNNSQIPAANYAVGGSGLGSQVVNFALQFVGNPYVWGGTSLTNGTDCSGFTMGVYRNFGVSLPHSSGAQRSCGYAVPSLAEALPGDLICYSGHVALYMGNGQIVHASTAATGIKISNVSYRSILAIRRIF